MPRRLTHEEIDKLASGPKVRRIAVENFLGTLPLGIGEEGNMINLDSDARSYGWNSQTRRAIERGIRLAFKEPKGGARRLPEVAGYFFDARLSEFRRTDNPHDSIPLDSDEGRALFDEYVNEEAARSIGRRE
jgi:hypothetical protein